MTEEIGTAVNGQPTSRSAPLLVIVAVSLLVGAGLGVAWSERRERPAGPGPADGGAVYVCGGQALAAVHAHGLGDDPVEVMLPLRGDGVLLPITRGGPEVLVGAMSGHQQMRPSNGHLALTHQVAPPVGATVAAQVGSRALSLAVRRCLSQ